jgi:hypothetical protein
VPIGVNDPYVSRLHGVLVCDGREWTRNKGKLPIQLPGEAMLLSGHELPVEPGYRHCSLQAMDTEDRGAHRRRGTRAAGRGPGSGSRDPA